MVNLIYLEGGEKHCRPISTLEAYVEACNSPENVKHWEAYRRTGDEQHKRALVQMNYNCQSADGALLKGNKTLSPFFFYDIDCSDREECRRIMSQLLQQKDELGLVEISESASYGVHAVARRQLGQTILECQVRLSVQTRTEMDTHNKENTRVVFHGPVDVETTPLLDEALFTESLTDEEAAREFDRQQERQKKGQEQVPPEAKKSDKHYRPWHRTGGQSLCAMEYPRAYHGIPFTDILSKYWELNNRGFEPTVGDRDTLTYQLACDLRHICGKNADWLDQVIPCYDGFSPEEKRAKIESALGSELAAFPMRLRNVLNALKPEEGDNYEILDEEEEANNNWIARLPKMPQGVSDSIESAEPSLTMPILTAVCPCIGALATGVKMDIHGDEKGLNLIAFIVGEFASGKGKIDPLMDAWMYEELALAKLYQAQEDEWRRKMEVSKNKKDLPEEPILPVRYVTLNNTVANLAQRLARVKGKHSFSFTCEADTVAQQWRSDMSNFSLMLRQSYDGSKYEREAKSVGSVNVHIEHLLWNVVLSGTPDSLYRVVRNYTDGFQSRIALACTRDNTFDQLSENPRMLTERQTERIHQVAHLLPLMEGTIKLPKLEAQGRRWLEKIRLETMKNNDVVKARQRFRICVTSQRMVCCLMLCKVCETLIRKHGLAGAEMQLKQDPYLWKRLLLKTQTSALLESFDVIADMLMENALKFFRDRIENARASRDYVGEMAGNRKRVGKNDTIYERLDPQFTFVQAMQQSVAVKGARVTQNSVFQMLKNWRNQNLVMQIGEGKYRKTS